jgi:hypothetical protein
MRAKKAVEKVVDTPCVVSRNIPIPRQNLLPECA